jgi:predicted membrane protein
MQSNRTMGIGFLIILAGFAILFHRLGLLPDNFERIVISWQMLLIFIGAWNLFFSKSRIAGFILIAVGGFFLLPDLFSLPYDFKRNFWPILLIIVGLFILVKAFPSKRREFPVQAEGDHQEFIEEVNIFSGSEKQFAFPNFRGGRITSIFGGSEIDLSASQMSEGNNILEVFYVFGGSSITVPNDWVVINKVTSILGGFSDKRRGDSTMASGPEKTLVIQGFVLLGGGEIKSR